MLRRWLVFGILQNVQWHRLDAFSGIRTFRSVIKIFRYKVLALLKVYRQIFDKLEKYDGKKCEADNPNLYTLFYEIEELIIHHISTLNINIITFVSTGLHKK